MDSVLCLWSQGPGVVHRCRNHLAPRLCGCPVNVGDALLPPSDPPKADRVRFRPCSHSVSCSTSVDERGSLTDFLEPSACLWLSYSKLTCFKADFSLSGQSFASFCSSLLLPTISKADLPFLTAITATPLVTSHTGKPSTHCTRGSSSASSSASLSSRLSRSFIKGMSYGPRAPSSSTSLSASTRRARALPSSSRWSSRLASSSCRSFRPLVSPVSCD